MTYTVNGTFVPSTNGTISGVGSAEVSYDEASRQYTISSTFITNATDLGAVSQSEREQAEADIRATLATFGVVIGPEHNDLNGVIQVTARTLDVNGGTFAVQDNTFDHPIIVQGVADTPSVTVVSPASAVVEGGNIPLNITVGRSPDDDGSEFLSVRITVPVVSSSGSSRLS